MKRPPPAMQATRMLVAPRRGAWIETLTVRNRNRPLNVAPRRGAWIETVVAYLCSASLVRSHPAGVRGLKH